MSLLQLRHFSREIALTKSQRRILYRETHKAWEREGRNFSRFCNLALVGIAALALLAYLYQPLFTRLGVWKSAAVIVVFVAAWFLAARAAMEAFCYGPIVRRVLRSQGHDVCLKCGYNLAGNVSGVCSECGEAVPESDAVAERGLG